jgi:Zn finger protein HypA/HybF involved in hydrogenase expression
MSADNPQVAGSTFQIVITPLAQPGTKCERLDCDNEASDQVSGSIPTMALCPSCVNEVKQVTAGARMKILRTMFIRKRRPAAPRPSKKSK